MIEGLPPNALVILNLVNPKEKFWGVLLSISAVGITLRGISLESFNEWVLQVARKDDESSLDLVTMFVPLFRVERLFLDEAVGSVKSYADYFEEMVGVSPGQYLSLYQTT